jgi:hypothetical protein
MGNEVMQSNTISPNFIIGGKSPINLLDHISYLEHLEEFEIPMAQTVLNFFVEDFTLLNMGYREKHHSNKSFSLNFLLHSYVNIELSCGDEVLYCEPGMNQKISLNIDHNNLIDTEYVVTLRNLDSASEKLYTKLFKYEEGMASVDNQGKPIIQCLSIKQQLLVQGNEIIDMCDVSKNQF